VRQSMDLDEFRSSEASFFKRAVLDAKLYNAQHPVGDPLRGRREKPADDDSVIRSLSGAPRLSAYLTSYLYRHHRSSLAAENLQYCELTLGEALLHAHTTPVPFLSLSDTLVVSPLMEGYDADDMWADLVSWVVHFATIEQAIRVHELVCPMHLDRYAAFLPILRERVLQCRECVAKGGPVVVMLGRKSELGDCPFRQHLEALALIPRD